MRNYTNESNEPVPQDVVDAIRAVAHTVMDRTSLGIGDVTQLVLDIGEAAGRAMPDRETVYEIVEDLADERIVAAVEAQP